MSHKFKVGNRKCGYRDGHDNDCVTFLEICGVMLLTILAICSVGLILNVIIFLISLI